VTAATVPKAELSVGNILCDIVGTTPGNVKAGILLFQKEGRLDLMKMYSFDTGLHGDTPEYGLPHDTTLVVA